MSFLKKPIEEGLRRRPQNVNTFKEGAQNKIKNVSQRAAEFFTNTPQMESTDQNLRTNADQDPASTSTADPSSTTIHPKVTDINTAIKETKTHITNILSNIIPNFKATNPEDPAKTTAQFSGINLNDIAGTTKFILNTLLSLLGKVFSMVGPSIFGPGHKAITQLFNENFKITPDIIGNLTTQLKSLAVNDENRAAIEKLAAETVTVIATLTPYLEKVNKQVLESSGDIAKKEAVGLTGLGFNVAASAIAEIPIIGGIIDLLLAFVRASNSVLKIGAKVMGTGSKIVGLGVEGATKVTENLAAEKVDPSAPPPVTIQQTGNGAMKKHQAIKKEIQSTIRRLQHRFKHFRKTRRRQQRHRGGGGGGGV